MDSLRTAQVTLDAPPYMRIAEAARIYVLTRRYFSRAFGGCREVRHRVRVLLDLGYAVTVIHGDASDLTIDGPVFDPKLEFIREPAFFDLSMKRYLRPSRWAAHQRARQRMFHRIKAKNPAAVMVHGERALRFYVQLQEVAPVIFFRHDSAIACNKSFRSLRKDYWLAGEGGIRKALLIARRLWEGRRIRHLKHFVVNSTYLAQIHNVRHAIIQYPPFIQDDESSPVLEFTQRDPGLIVFAGRVEPAKGPQEAIRILANLPMPFHLRILGEGPLRSECEQLAWSLGCRDRVEFAGLVTPGDVHESMRQAWITLIPSLVDEAFPLTAIESQACGTPVVGYDSGGTAEAIGPYCGEIVRPGDHHGAAVHILNICKSPGTWNESSHACVEAAEQFSPERFRQSVQELLSEVIGET